MVVFITAVINELTIKALLLSLIAVWDNKIEQNYPIGMCGVCTPDDRCVMDHVTVIYFDKAPFRSGMCCWCIPATCCGPPVVFSAEPMKCGGLCSDAKSKGVAIYGSPCDMWGLKTYVCCGSP